jgi:hypothetical protein
VACSGLPYPHKVLSINDILMLDTSTKLLAPHQHCWVPGRLNTCLPPQLASAPSLHRHLQFYACVQAQILQLLCDVHTESDVDRGRYAQSYTALECTRV